MIRPRYNGEYAHICAKDVQQRHPWEFENFFKFAFVRNPYAQALSLYRYRMGNQSTFSHFLHVLSDSSVTDTHHMRRRNNWEPTGWEVFTIKDQVAMDFVGRFEDMHHDLAKIHKELGMAFDPTLLPHAKNTGKSFGTSYREHYTDHDRKIVANLWGREIEEFKYQF